MFNPKAKTSEPAPTGRTSIIGEGMTITGEINTQNDIRIDGKLVGNIHSTARVVIGTGGYVEGNIIALQADITGQVKGNMLVKEVLHLRDNAVVNGDIEAAKIAMEPSAVFNGKCKMQGGITVPALVASPQPLQVVEMIPEANERKVAAR